MIPLDLLEIIRCPRTGQPLTLASAEQISVAANKATDRSESFGEGLVSADGSYFYPVREGLPFLLVQEAIQLA